MPMKTVDSSPRPSGDPYDTETNAWRALEGGDRSAADALVEMTYERIYSALFKLTRGDEDLAADLTQETYRKAWASLGSFRGDCAFSSWLYRIAHTTFLSHVRRPRRVEPLEEPERVEAEEPSALRQAQSTEEARRLHRAVAALPEELQFAVTARYWNDTPVKEIAVVQGISEVGVRKRLIRARKQLAELLNTDETKTPLNH